MQRRLAAIVAIDVVGYSRLMGRSEAGTLAALKAIREELVDPAIAAHGGRIVKTTGDGLLLDFPSAVRAVECAVQVQEAMAERNAALPQDARMQLRIGINLGDVVEEDGDLFGDGVNVAARLEAAAEPGGLAVSAGVHDQLAGRTDIPFQDAGEQLLKNIDRPVRVWRWGAAAALPPPLPPPPAADRPSIAVLPFDNLSDEPGHGYFSDGVTEDIITELSRFKDLLVIARNSSFAFRGKGLDAGEIGRRLGVRYLLEGSVRRIAGRIRITAQLIDGASGGHLWAERFDRPIDEIFAVQDEVVATIVATLVGRIEAAATEHAKRKPPADLAAYDLVLQGLDHLASYTEGANARAGELFEEATALDPSYALAFAYHALAIYTEFTGDRTDDAELRRALTLAERAEALDGQDSRIHRILAEIALALRQHDRAEFHAARSLALNPNDAHASAYTCYILTSCGRPQEAMAHIQKAMQLNPHHPGWYWYVLGRTLHACGRHEEALKSYMRVPMSRAYHMAYMAACCMKIGDEEGRRRHLAAALAADPAFSVSDWLARLPFRHEADRASLAAELRDAGLPQ